MSRKFKSTERFQRPDPKYQDLLVTKFVNCLMWDGKRSIAQTIFYDAIELVGQRIKDEEAIQVFHSAVRNVKPLIEVRSKRVGGATYQVPREVGKKRQQSLAFRWILEASRDKQGKPMSHRLADELCAAYRREGTAYTKRENVHKMAEANKAFAHFAW